MSWSASFDISEDGLTVEDSGGESNINPEWHQDQYEAVLDAVWEIIKTGVVGEGKRFKVTASGHGNPGHVPLSGWSNDYVTLTIYQQ